MKSKKSWSLHHAKHSHIAGLSGFSVAYAIATRNISVSLRMGRLSIARFLPALNSPIHICAPGRRDVLWDTLCQRTQRNVPGPSEAFQCLAWPTDMCKWPYRLSLNWHRSVCAVVPNGLILLITTSSPVSSRFQCLEDIPYHQDSKKKVLQSLLKTFYTATFLLSR